MSDGLPPIPGSMARGPTQENPQVIQAQREQRRQELLGLYQQMNEDIGFRKLSYESQTELRAKAWSNILSYDDQFLALPDGAKAQAYSQLVSGPPVFENQQFGSEVTNIANQASSGVTDARKLIDSTLIQDRLHKASLLYNLVDKQIIDPILRESSNDIKDNELKPYDFSTKTEDAKKALSVFRQTRDQFAQWAQERKVVENVAGFTAGAIEIVGTTLLGAGTVAAPRALGKLTTMGISKAITRAGAASNVAKYLFPAKGAAHALATGSIGYVREMGLQWANDNLNKYSKFSEFASDSAAIFGSYVAFDILGNFFFDTALPFIRGSSRVFKGYGESKEFFKDMDIEKAMDDILFKPKFDVEQISRMDPISKEHVKDVWRTMAVAHNVEKASQVDLIHTAAMTRGYGVAAAEDGTYNVTNWAKHKLSGKGVKNFADLDGVQKYLGRQFAFETVPEQAAAKGALHRNVKVREVLHGSLKNVAGEDIDTLANAIAPKAGRYTKDQVSNFTKFVLRKSGASKRVISETNIIDRGGKLTVRIPGEDPVVIPKVLRKNSETPYVRTLMKSIEHAVGGANPRAAVVGGALSDFTTYEESILRQNLYTPGWVFGKAHQLQIPIETAGKYINIWRADGTKISFEHLNDAADYILRRGIDENYLKNYLSQYEGMKLVKPKSGGYLVKDGQKTIATGATIEELLGARPELVKYAPASLGPEVVLTSSTGRLRYEFNVNTLTGDYHQVMKHLNGYRNPKTYTTTLKNKDGKILRLNRASAAERRFNVHIPELQYTTPELSLKEAQEFLQKGTYDAGHIRRIAADKGYRLDVAGGKYILYSGDGTKVTADNLQELGATLAEVPVPPWAPEYISFTDDFADNLPKVPEHMLADADIANVPLNDKLLKRMLKSQKNFFNMTLGRYTRPAEAYINDLVEMSSNKELAGELAGHFNDLTRMIRFVNTNEYKLYKLANTVYLDDTGRKLIPEDRRIVLGWLQEIEPNSPEYLKFVKDNHISPQELKIADNMRTFFGKARGQGLGGMFLDEGDDWVNNYLPHIRRRVLEDPEAFQGMSDGEVETFFRHIFGDQPPKKIDAFFKHNRVSDLRSMAMEQDPLKIMFHYISVGNRHQFLGPIYEKIDKRLVELQKAGNVGDGEGAIISRLNAYRADVMGITNSGVDDAIDRGIRMFARTIGWNDVDAELLRNSVLSLPYFAAMGFRAWLPIRNVHQIFTMLAPRVGNHYVKLAVKELANDPKGYWANLVRQKGIITSRVPIGTGDVITNNFFDSFRGPVGRGYSKLLRKSLQWYRNSDEYTRVVAYVAGLRKWEDATAALKSGKIGIEEFVNEQSGMHLLYSTRKKTAMGALNEGNWSGVKDETLSDLVDQTMFRYRAGESPFGRSFLGRAFGQMGTYPIQYVESVRQGFRSGLPSARAAYGLTFATNSLALYGIYKDLLGVNANNFLPWVPTMFSGGPLFDVMVNSLQMMNPSYKGRQARAEMLGIKSSGGNVRWEPLSGQLFQWYPLSFQMKYMAKAAKHFNEGQYYRAFLDITGTPTNKNFFSGQ